MKMFTHLYVCVFAYVLNNKLHACTGVSTLHACDLLSLIVTLAIGIAWNGPKTMYSSIPGLLPLTTIESYPFDGALGI